MDDITDRLNETFPARISRLGGSLGAAGHCVATFIAQNPAAALASSAMDLAVSTGTSDATVVRTVQALGYAGLADLKRALVALLKGDVTTSADDMRRTLDDLGDDAILAVDTVLAAHEEALTTLRSAEFKEQLGRALPVLHGAKRIVVFGIGPSAALAGYVAVLLARGGRRSMCLDATGIMLADQMLELRVGGSVLALALWPGLSRGRRFVPGGTAASSACHTGIRDSGQCDHEMDGCRAGHSAREASARCAAWRNSGGAGSNGHGIGRG